MTEDEYLLAERLTQLRAAKTILYEAGAMLPEGVQLEEHRTMMRILSRHVDQAFAAVTLEASPSVPAVAPRQTAWMKDETGSFHTHDTPDWHPDGACKVCAAVDEPPPVPAVATPSAKG